MSCVRLQHLPILLSGGTSVLPCRVAPGQQQAQASATHCPLSQAVVTSRVNARTPSRRRAWLQRRFPRKFKGRIEQAHGKRSASMLVQSWDAYIRRESPIWPRGAYSRIGSTVLDLVAAASPTHWVSGRTGLPFMAHHRPKYLIFGPAPTPVRRHRPRPPPHQQALPSPRQVKTQ
jgi:hypothetical protein